MVKAKLIVVGGDPGYKQIVLQLPAVFGRGRDVTVNLSHPLVSRRHCEILEVDGQLIVRDLNSLNGTFVGSQRITEAVLAPGDLLTIGTVTFRAIYEDADHAWSDETCRPDRTEPVAPPSQRPPVPSEIETIRVDGTEPENPAHHPSRHQIHSSDRD